MACAVTLITAACAYTATPVFQLSSAVRPVAINELDALNRSQVYQLTPDMVLTAVGAV